MYKMGLSRLLLQDTAGKWLLAIMLSVVAVASVLNLTMPEGSALHVSSYTITLLGKYLCYGLLALALDLVWGYCGILSLGHGAFFALGGYAMGMYLVRQIGDRGVYGNAELPDFMVFLNWQGIALVLAWVRFILVRHGHGGTGSRITGFSVWLAGVSLACNRGLSVHYYSGNDVCPVAAVLPE